MENSMNISSEEELAQLRNDGKISQEEYEQLLAAMNKNVSVTPGPITSGKPNIPLSLKIVACLFIIGGILAGIEIITALIKGRVSLSLGVIGLFVGYGLLKLRRGWRTCALVFLWILFIGIPIISMFYITQPSSGFNVQMLGEPLSRNPIFILLLNIFCFLPLLWSYRVLTRPDIKSLFGIDSH